MAVGSRLSEEALVLQQEEGEMMVKIGGPENSRNLLRSGSLYSLSLFWLAMYCLLLYIDTLLLHMSVWMIYTHEVLSAV